MKIKYNKKYNYLVSLENLLKAWQQFERGKKSKIDVQEFSLHLMDNIFSLHSDLIKYTYNHGGYQAFKINDPKPRDIHKAQVRDRLLHHAVYQELYPFFDKTFISDSYSCRKQKGTHKAVKRLQYFLRQASQNNTRNCYVLQCDIKKFFASINQKILLDTLTEYILDKDILQLLQRIIFSFQTKPKTGLPLGNLTSQLFVNVYMNKFDQFIKHKLKVKKYIRYADDFVIAHQDKEYLKSLIEFIQDFLKTNLNLELHPQKVKIRKYSQGVDFLGYIILPHHILLRTKTKKRMFKKIKFNKEKLDQGLINKEFFNQSLQSYYGILKHCESYKLRRKIETPSYL